MGCRPSYMGNYVEKVEEKYSNECMSDSVVDHACTSLHSNYNSVLQNNR